MSAKSKRRRIPRKKGGKSRRSSLLLFAALELQEESRDIVYLNST